MVENLPEIGTYYEHGSVGYVCIIGVHKRGRGYYVTFEADCDVEADGRDVSTGRMRLRDWQKGVQ